MSAIGAGAWSAFGQITDGSAMAALDGFVGDRLRRNISQWLKTFDIHRHVGLIEMRQGTGAGLMAGRWLEASTQAVEWSGDPFLRQRASAMLDRILGAARADGPPFPEMSRADVAAMRYALETIAELWFNGPAREVADRLHSAASDRRQGLDANTSVRTTETERLSEVLEELRQVLARTGDGVLGDGVLGEGAWGDAVESLLWNQVFACQTVEGDSFRSRVAFNGVPGEIGGEKTGAAGALMLSRIPWMFYAVDGDNCWIHQYGSSEVSLRMGGVPVRLAQVTSYPEGEDVAVEVRAGGGDFELRLRMPGWCSMPSVQVNGVTAPARTERGYAGIRRKWQPGDRVTLRFPMEARWIRTQTGEYELGRGPVLYCVRMGDLGRVRRESLTTIATLPAKFGPTYQVRVILEAGSVATTLAEPFAFSGWGGPYRTAIQAD